MEAAREAGRLRGHVPKPRRQFGHLRHGPPQVQFPRNWGNAQRRPAWAGIHGPVRGPGEERRRSAQSEVHKGEEPT